MFRSLLVSINYMSDNNGLCGYSLLSLSYCILFYKTIYCGAFYYFFQLYNLITTRFGLHNLC